MVYVYDVNDETALQSVEDWIEDTNPRNSKNASWTPLRFLIGNKIDTPGTRVILSSDGRDFAEKYEMKYYETK